MKVIPYVTMIGVVASANYLVQFPINDWLTWGAFPYPLSFLVTEATNLYYGPKAARKVVYVGFILALIISMQVASLKIASASCLAFLNAQMLDIAVFNKIRSMSWWKAPFFASFFASLIDTLLFWNLAFYGEQVPLFTWTLGDFGVKLIMDLLLLAPFRLLLRKNKRARFLSKIY